MKNNILNFIIGVLVGAIITMSVFLIYEKVNRSNMSSEERPQMTERENGEAPLEKPNDDAIQTNEPPPEMPSKINSDSKNNI